MFKKLKKFYRNNRIYCILMIISVICIMVMGVSVIVYFYNQLTTNSYGSRLENIDRYDLGNSLNDLENFYKDQTGVENVSVRLQGKIRYELFISNLINEYDIQMTTEQIGKIIYVDVKVVETMNNEQIQSLATSSLDKISEENRGFYDIQYIFARNNLNPYMGAKNSGNTVIVWTNYTYDTESTTTGTKK